MTDAIYVQSLDIYKKDSFIFKQYNHMHICDRYQNIQVTSNPRLWPSNQV